MSSNDTGSASPSPQVSAEQAAAEQLVAGQSSDRRRSAFHLILGFPVIFRVAEGHLTKTVRGGVELEGSIFHAEQTEFAGIIGRIRPAGDTPESVTTADIALIIPGQSDLRWVEGVPEGDEPGSFRPISG